MVLNKFSYVYRNLQIIVKEPYWIRSEHLHNFIGDKSIFILNKPIVQESTRIPILVDSSVPNWNIHRVRNLLVQQPGHVFRANTPITQAMLNSYHHVGRRNWRRFPMYPFESNNGSNPANGS